MSIPYFRVKVSKQNAERGGYMYIQGVYYEIVKGRCHVKDIGLDGRRCNNGRFGFMGWVFPAQDRDLWQAFVNTIMNIYVQWKAVFLVHAVTEYRGCRCIAPLVLNPDTR
jgi:hypothetical protein